MQFLLKDIETKTLLFRNKSHETGLQYSLNFRKWKFIKWLEQKWH